MKHHLSIAGRFGALFLACAAGVALAETSISVSTFDLYKGSKKVQSFKTAAECSAAAMAAKGKMLCKNVVTYVTTPDPVRPPTDHHAGVPVAETSQWPTPQPGVSDVRLYQGTVPALPDLLADPYADGAFRLLCNWARMSFDDPIVYPAKPGEAHHHTFFGNTGIDAATTSENIRSKGNATCRGGTINLSGYWHPSMIDTATGRPIAPKVLLVYYKTGKWHYFNDPTQVIQPLPKGMKMVAGDATRTTPGGVGNFLCMRPAIGESRPETVGSGIPVCLPGEELWFTLPFPQCWDGVNLDSPDHKGHMAYPITFWAGDPQRQFRCPTTHPVVLPQISMQVEWTLPAVGDTSKWRLSSDTYTGPAGYSLHADWMNGWDPAISDLWGIKCMRDRRQCGSANLGDGRETAEFQGN